MDNIQKLGMMIKKARTRKGLSQEALAELLDVSATHVKHMESGHRKPSVELLFTLAKLLSMSVDEVIFGIGEEEKLDLQLQAALTECTVKEKQILAEITSVFIKYR